MKLYGKVHCSTKVNIALDKRSFTAPNFCCFLIKILWLPLVKVFQILPEFRIFSLTFQRKKVRLTGPQIRERNEKYFSYFSTKTYVVGTQKNRLNETVLLSTQNTCLN